MPEVESMSRILLLFLVCLPLVCAGCPDDRSRPADSVLDAEIDGVRDEEIERGRKALAHVVDRNKDDYFDPEQAKREMIEHWENTDVKAWSELIESIRPQLRDAAAQAWHLAEFDRRKHIKKRIMQEPGGNLWADKPTE